MAAVEQYRLPALAEEINQEIRRADESWRDAVGHAIRAGELLTEAKGLVKHGEWLPWVSTNFHGSERTASLYMRLAANRQTVADLPTVRDAVAMLTKPRDEPARDDEMLGDDARPSLDETAAEIEALTRERMAESVTEDIERKARDRLAERRPEAPANSHLAAAELEIEKALVSRELAARAALAIASEAVECGHPKRAAAASRIAAAWLVDPWDEDGAGDEAWEAYQAACREERAD